MTSGPQLVSVTTLVDVTTSSPDEVAGKACPPDEIGKELLPVGYGTLEDPDPLGSEPLDTPAGTLEAGAEGAVPVTIE